MTEFEPGNGRKRFTYIIGDDDAGIFKIGKSNRPHVRLGQHQRCATAQQYGANNLRLLAIFYASDVSEMQLRDILSWCAMTIPNTREWFWVRDCVATSRAASTMLQILSKNTLPELMYRAGACEESVQA